MITAAAVVNFIEVLACIAVLIWFFYGPWNRFVVDLARQNLFEIRDAVFMMAADGRITYDNPTYIRLRNFLNITIRFAEHYTLGSMIAAGDKEASRPTLLQQITDLPDRDLAHELRDHYINAVLLLLVSMVFRSALWTLISMFMLPFVILREMLQGVGHASSFTEHIGRRMERDVDRSNAFEGLAA